MPLFRASYPALEEHLVREVRRLRATDRLTRMLLVVPRPLLGQALLRVLARAGEPVFGVVPMTLEALATRLAAAGLGAANLRPLSPPAARVLMRDLLASLPRGHVFDACRDLPGVPDRLRRTVETLRAHGLGLPALRGVAREGGFGPQVEARLEALGEMLQKVAVGLEVEHWADRSDLTRLATEAAARAEWLGDFSGLLVYGALAVSPAETRLLGALAERMPVAGVFVCEGAEREPGMAPFLRWAEDVGPSSPAGDPLPPPGPAGDPRPAPRPAEDPLPPPGPAGDPRPGRALRLLSVPGPGREGREIARELAGLAHLGLRWHEMAVLAAGGDEEARRLARDLASFDIPCYLAPGEPLASQRPGRSMLCLLEVMERDFPRLATIECLQLLEGFTAPGFAGGVPLPDLCLLEAASARAMIRGGGEAWQRMAERQALRLAERRDPASRRDVDALRRGAAWVAALAELRSGLPREATPEEHARALSRVLRTLMHDGAERRTLEGLVLEMGAWRSGARLDRPAFHRLVRERLEEEAVRDARFGQGTVFVGALEAGAGLRFRATVLQGLDAGTFPPSPDEDPLILDDEKDVVERLLGARLPRSAWEVPRAEALLSALAGSATERVVLCWSRLNAQGQPQSPSPLLLDLVGREWGHAVTAHELEDLCRPGTMHESLRCPSLSRLVPEAGETPPEAGLLLLDLQELAMARAVAGADGDPDLPPPVARASVERLQAAARAARTPGLTPWDGCIQEPGTRECLVAWLDLHGPWPVTAFERYATCPRAFLLERILDLRPLPRPEEADAMDGAAFGSLLHRVLEGLFRHLGSPGAVPFSWPPPPAVLEALDTAWDEAAREARAGGRAGNRLQWERTSREARDRLMAFLQWQARQDGWTPRRFEMDTEPFEVVVTSDGRAEALLLRGRIDRVDFRPGARSARIIDYKTSSASADTPPGKGKALQLPLYARALESRPGFPGRVEEALYLCLEGADRITPKAYSRDDLEPMAKTVDDCLATIRAGIRDGLFFPNPESGGPCRTCPFTGWCGRGVGVVARRKLADFRLAPFHAMKGYASVAEAAAATPGTSPGDDDDRE